MFALHAAGFGSRHLGQAIVRVVMIDGSGSDQFVFYKNGRGNRALVQDVEADSNNIFPIAFRKVGDRSNKAGSA